ncbi:MAG: hypothetical protein CXT78_16985 [Thaumarchaeota archaeon]|jgi:hypothetical protein|nr:MAG: hypothetical protein CXT78_16985 [Nitrososphaerota archaeon]
MDKTPADKWRDAIKKYKIQCQNILKISGHIRYAGVINTYGKTLTGVIQPDLKPLLKSEEIKNEFFIVSTLISLRKANNSTIGKLDHIIFKHSKINIVVFHKKEVTFYVSISSKEKNLDKLISLIKK